MNGIWFLICSLFVPLALGSNAFAINEHIKGNFDLAEAEKFNATAIGELRGKYSNLPEKFDKPERYQSGTVDGVAFIISADLTDATIGEWNVTCKKDAITDRKFCRANFKDLDIDQHDDGRLQVSIGSGNFPGSNVTIRINRGNPISSQSSPSGNPWFAYGVSNAIVNSLKTAQTVTTRYKQFPYESYIDDTWDVRGFNGVYAYLRWAIKRMK